VAAKEDVMARDAALVVKLDAGGAREGGQGARGVSGGLAWWGEQAAEGRCGRARAFDAGDASGGMVMVGGRSELGYL
jgi:hypothetical protein